MSQFTRGAESHPLSFHLIETPHDRRFSDLAAIYTAAHPASELKPVSALASMVQRPEYLFLIVARE